MYGLWDVEGSFIVPGTRERGKFGPMRISAASKQEASAQVAPLLQREFGRDATTQDKRPFIFGSHFALYHLTFREVVPMPATKPVADQP